MSTEAVHWFKEHAGGFTGQLLFDEPLSRFTYYRIGGPAALVASPKCKGDVEWLAQGIQETGIPFIILGMGSNILIPDRGYPGLVIRANRINLEIEPKAQGRLWTGSSVAISSLLRRASQEGWGGLEFLTGIPGSVGGVVTMNAGTHLGEAQGRLRSVEVFMMDQSAELKTFENGQLQYAYRKNLFLPKGCLIWGAEWEFVPEDPNEVKARIDQLLLRRKNSQPVDYPSCGSVFKNPKESGLSAWQVIERLGLRGFQIGGAQFSEKHCNFIINLGNAKAEDVRALIQLAKDRALQDLGIRLEEEVILLE